MIRLLDVASEEIKVVASYSKGNTSGLAFSPDGKYLVAGAENRVLLFSVPQLQIVKELSQHQDYVTNVAFAPDSKKMASISWDKTARIWDAASGEQLANFTLTEGYPKAVTFSGDGKSLIVGSSSGQFYIWNLISKEAQIVNAHSDQINYLAYNCLAGTLASASSDLTLKLWDAASFAELKTLSGHSQTVFALAFSTDGKIIVSGSADKTMRVWDTASGQELLAATGHKDIVSALALSADGDYLISGSSDNELRVWETATAREILAVVADHEINGVAFNSARMLIAGGGNRKIHVWDGKTGQVLAILEGHTNNIRWLHIDRAGHYLYSAGWDRTLRQWDMNTMKMVAEYQMPGSVESALFWEDRQLLFLGHWYGEITCWDLAENKVVHTFKAHNLAVLSLGLIQNGQYLVSSSEDAMLKVWDTANWQLVKSIQFINLTRFTTLPGTAGLALIQGKTIEVWSAITAEKLQIIPQTTVPFALISGKDAGKIIVGNLNGTIAVYTNK